MDILLIFVLAFAGLFLFYAIISTGLHWRNRDLKDPSYDKNQEGLSH